jgi:hypothetical protein
MSVSVYSHDANVGVDKRVYRLNDKRGAEMVAAGQGEFITVDGRIAIRKFAPKEVLAERGARNQVLPYVKARPIGLVNAPRRHHYPVPACGDRRLRWLARFMMSEKAAETIA